MSFDLDSELFCGIVQLVKVVLVQLRPQQRVAVHFRRQDRSVRRCGRGGELNVLPGVKALRLENFLSTTDWAVSLNWKYYTSARQTCRPIRIGWSTHLELRTSHTLPPLVSPKLLHTLHRLLQQTPRTRMQRFPRRRIAERDEEQGNIVLPWQTTVSCQIDFSGDVAETVGGVGDGEFFVVGLVVDIPPAVRKGED